MGMTRKYQPDAIVNPRYGWVGDIAEEEGAREITGKIRSDVITDKCFPLQLGPWGYSADANAHGHLMTRDDLIRHLANAVVRDMVVTVNVSPDRHGAIPDPQQQRLRELGAWLAKT